MRIKFPAASDARGWREMSGYAGDIIDLDSGESIGHIDIHQGSWRGKTRSHTRTVSIMGYSEDFDTHGECYAFAKGVEAVINRVLPPHAKKSDTEAA